MGGGGEVYEGQAHYGQTNPNVRLKFGAIHGRAVPVSALVRPDRGRLE
ncbi:hypothetical protein ACFVXC_29830 [Streptomyces sp. NPDC058257]